MGSTTFFCPLLGIVRLVFSADSGGSTIGVLSSAAGPKALHAYVLLHAPARQLSKYRFVRLLFGFEIHSVGRLPPNLICPLVPYWHAGLVGLMRVVQEHARSSDPRG